jgi:hypothetical protein
MNRITIPTAPSHPWGAVLLAAVLPLVIAAAAYGRCPSVSPDSLAGEPPGWTHVDLPSMADLHQAIADAGERTVLHLGPGTFCLTGHGSWDYGVLLQGKTDLVVRGSGWDRTILSLPADLDFGIYIGGHLRRVTLECFAIMGTLPLAVNTHAIGNYTGVGYTPEVHGLTIRDLAIRDVAVGISLANWYEANVYDSVLVTHNRLENMVGSLSGSGYGIHADNPSRARIVGNYVRNAGRHGVYLGRAAAGGDVRIDGNLVYEHDREATNPLRVVSALVCARASDVRLTFNTVLNPRPYAMSVEADDVFGWPTDDVVLVGNRVYGAQDAGLWVATGQVHTALGNAIEQRGDNPYPELRLELTPGSGLVAPDPRWPAESAPSLITRWQDQVFIMVDGNIDRLRPFAAVGPADWTATRSRSQWPGARYLCAGPGAAPPEGVLYVGLPGDAVQRVDAATLEPFGDPVAGDLITFGIEATLLERRVDALEYRLDVSLDASRFAAQRFAIAEWDLALPAGARLLSAGAPGRSVGDSLGTDFFTDADEAVADRRLGVANRRMTRDPFAGVPARSGRLARYRVAVPPAVAPPVFGLARCLVVDSDLRLYAGDQVRVVASTAASGATGVHRWRLGPGWALVSLPLQPPDCRVSALLPAASALFGFGGAYEAASALDPGRGYWAQMTTPTTGAVAGSPWPDTILVRFLPAGWSLVGPGDVALDAEGLRAAAPALASVFGYQDGYYAATALEPGHAYWVNMRSPAELDLSGRVAPAARTAVPPVAPPRPTAPCVWLGGDAGARAIELGAARERPVALPPPPPAEVFDVRVELGPGLATWQVPATGGLYPLRLQGRVAWLRWEGLVDAGWVAQIGAQTLPLRGTGTAAIAPDAGVWIGRQGSTPGARLLAVAPNPANPTTRIRYELTAPGGVQVRVFTAAGQRVRRLGALHPDPGVHELEWDGCDDRGLRLASGVYLCEFEGDGYRAMRRLVLLR